MDIRLNSGSFYSRSIGGNDIRACLTAQREKDVVSLWGKIADWFLGTKVEAAKVALFRLAHADTLAQQLSSFSELKQYVAPARQDLLTWQISDSDPPVFQIGGFEIRCHAATKNTMADLPPFDLDDRARLLCSMHYDGQNVVSEYHYFAAQSLAFTERTADAVLAAQERFLSLNPNLLSALKLIGLDQNDVQGDFARDTSLTVERLVSQTTGDEDTAVRAARNTENLSIFASNTMRTFNAPDTRAARDAENLSNLASMNMRTLNAPDTSISRSEAAQTRGLEPALIDIDNPLDAIRAIRLRALNSNKYVSPAGAALELISDRLKAGQLREANFAYTVFAERYPRNAGYVAGVVPAKVLNHYWRNGLGYLGGERVTTWQTRNPKWVDDGVEALLDGKLDTWAKQALAEIRTTAAGAERLNPPR